MSDGPINSTTGQTPPQSSWATFEQENLFQITRAKIPGVQERVRGIQRLTHDTDALAQGSACSPQTGIRDQRDPYSQTKVTTETTGKSQTYVIVSSQYTKYNFEEGGSLEWMNISAETLCRDNCQLIGKLINRTRSAR